MLRAKPGQQRLPADGLNTPHLSQNSQTSTRAELSDGISAEVFANFLGGAARFSVIYNNGGQGEFRAQFVGDIVVLQPIAGNQYNSGCVHEGLFALGSKSTAPNWP